MVVKDGVTSIFIVILMFIIPKSPVFLKCFKRSTDLNQLRKLKPSEGLVTWSVIHKNTPWGLMFLLGAGFALAEGAKTTGLSESIGQSLMSIGQLNHLLILFIVVAMTEFITEFTSNVAICNLVLPVLASLSRNIKGMEPLYLMVPACHACSFAMMMPVGTPPNAIVAGMINMPTAKMAYGGFIPKIISTVVIWGTYPIYGEFIFSH